MEKTALVYLASNVLDIECAAKTNIVPVNTQLQQRRQVVALHVKMSMQREHTFS
jgi:hypothetical protein